MRVEVYFNLHRKLWSVRDLSTGLVVDHVDEIAIKDPRFTVQPAGRRKVIKEGRKNVHAFVRGERIERPQLTADDVWFGSNPVYYNPYKCCQDCGTLELCAGLDTCRATFITKPDRVLGHAQHDSGECESCDARREKEGAPIHRAGLAILSGRAVTAYIQE